MEKKSFLAVIDSFLGEINAFFIKAYRRFMLINEEQLIFFSYQLSMLINSGVKLHRGLELIANQIDDEHFKKIVNKVRDDVYMGSTLFEALKKHREYFPEVFMNSVRSGEKGGTLDRTLKKLTESMEKDYGIMKKVQSALTYPFIVLILSFIFSFICFIVVFPKLAEFFNATKVSLPLITQFFIVISKIFTNIYFYAVMIFIIGGLIIFLKKKFENEHVRFQLDLFKINIPVLGTLFKKISVLKFNNSFRILVGTGMHIGKSLELSGYLAENQVFRESLKQIRNRVTDGRDLATSFFEEGNLFPSFYFQLVRVGEATGNLDFMLLKASDILEGDINETLEKVTTLMGPVFLGITGIFVGCAVLAIYMPLSKMIGQLS